MPTADEYRQASETMNRLAELKDDEEEVKDEAKRVLGVEFNMSDTIATSLNIGPVFSELEEINKLSNDLSINATQARKYLDVFPKEYIVKEQTVPDLIKSLRKARRALKGDDRDKMSKSIDTLIEAYSDHISKCIDSIYWVSPYRSALIKMRFNEKDLHKLYKMKDKEMRREVVDSLCKYWEAEQNQKDMAYGKDFASLQKTMKVAKKEFRDCIAKISDQSITKSKKERIEDFILKAVCDSPGISAGQIHDSMPSVLYKSSSPSSISQLVRKLDVVNSNGSLYKFSSEIKKNIWAYTAAFIDSDGYITMDRSHNPRVGLIATGERGKAFMQEMYKSIGFGRLHLDQKSPQDTRPVNRLNFYSQDDVYNLLTKCLPHFRMKKGNAELLLELVRMKKSHKSQSWYKERCDEIFKLMKWENHKDHVGFDFAKEGIYVDDISKFQANSKMSMMDELEGIGTIIKFDRVGLEQTYPDLRKLPDEAVREFERKINDRFNSKSASEIIRDLLTKYRNQLRSFRKSEGVKEKLEKGFRYA